MALQPQSASPIVVCLESQQRALEKVHPGAISGCARGQRWQCRRWAATQSSHCSGRAVGHHTMTRSWSEYFCMCFAVAGKIKSKVLSAYCSGVVHRYCAGTANRHEPHHNGCMAGRTW
jgi:hypothetical protein